MSKREILTVCELAAHLHNHTVHKWIDEWVLEREFEKKTPMQCASDAMALQRLGRRARRHIEKCDKRGGIYWRAAEEHELILHLGQKLLAPYGLEVDMGETTLLIKGLPSNTGGEGFSI